MSKLNRKLIFYILGLLLMFNGFAMLISAFVSYLTKDSVEWDDISFFVSDFFRLVIDDYLKKKWQKNK